MLSLFWKNARFPQKGQNGAKVGGAVGKKQGINCSRRHFWENARFADFHTLF